MNPLATMELARSIYDDRRRSAADAQRVAAARHARRDEGELVIRRARRRDARRLERLAALDSGPTPAGPTLVAELNGCLVAALPLGGGRPVADPFVPSAPLVQLLELRAAQLQAA